MYSASETLSLSMELPYRFALLLVYENLTISSRSSLETRYNHLIFPSTFVILSLIRPIHETQAWSHERRTRLFILPAHVVPRVSVQLTFIDCGLVALP